MAVLVSEISKKLSYWAKGNRTARNFGKLNEINTSGRFGLCHPPRSSFKGGSLIEPSNHNPTLSPHAHYSKRKSYNQV